MGIFAKKHFSEKKNFRNLLTQEYYTFLKAAQNSASFDTLCAQFRRNFLSIRVLFDVFFRSRDVRVMLRKINMGMGRTNPVERVLFKDKATRIFCSFFVEKSRLGPYTETIDL